MESNQIDILAPSMLSGLEQVEDTKKARLASQLGVISELFVGLDLVFSNRFRKASLAYNAPPGMNSGTSYWHFNLEEAQP